MKQKSMPITRAAAVFVFLICLAIWLAVWSPAYAAEAWTVELAPDQTDFRVAFDIPEQAKAYSGAEMLVNIPADMRLIGYEIDGGRFPNAVSSFGDGGRLQPDGSLEYRFGFFTTQNTFRGRQAGFLALNLEYAKKEQRTVVVKELTVAYNDQAANLVTHDRYTDVFTVTVSRLPPGGGGDEGPGDGGDEGPGDGGDEGPGDGGGEGPGDGGDKEPGGGDGTPTGPTQPGRGGGAPSGSGTALTVPPRTGANADTELGEAETPLAGFTGKHIQYINGYPDGTFRPDYDVTRAEAVAMLFRLLLDEQKDDPLANPFSDVLSGEWYTQSVAYMASIGAVVGYPDGRFMPDAPITRAEFATLVTRLGGDDASLAGQAPVFPDVTFGH
ncbi:MAG: S-layer homology domain-containing protein, partial [Clostridiales bacterium]|nr:S-layer homology domain-containing protein [Clostridiales bacterium]